MTLWSEYINKITSHPNEYIVFLAPLSNVSDVLSNCVKGGHQMARNILGNYKPPGLLETVRQVGSTLAWQPLKTRAFKIKAQEYSNCFTTRVGPVGASLKGALFYACLLKKPPCNPRKCREAVIVLHALILKVQILFKNLAQLRKPEQKFRLTEHENKNVSQFHLKTSTSQYYFKWIKIKDLKLHVLVFSNEVTSIHS